MKVCVWLTGHAIADTVGSQVRYGLGGCSLYYTKDICDQIITDHDVHIGYGILRDMDKVFKACDKLGKPWFNIDRGYWKPGHYDGYYRVSLRGTQQITGLDKLKPDYDRWDRLGIDLFLGKDGCGLQLLCPPTSQVSAFFPKSFLNIRPPVIERSKGCERPLQDDLDACGMVITFNSSVGWEALRQGIPVISDSNYSIVGAYQKLVDKDIHDDLDRRRELFSLMSSLQLTLDEIRSGKIWELMQKLLQCSSGGMDVKR